MLRFSKITFLSVVALVVLHILLMLNWSIGQDSCSFGTVSNAEYRSLKSRVKFHWWQPFPIPRSTRSSTDFLSTKYRELAPVESDLNLKVAAAHAMLRSLGAVYRQMEEYPTKSGGYILHIIYTIDLNKLFYFRPILRNMKIHVWIYNTIEADKESKNPPISVIYSSIEAGFLADTSYGQTCLSFRFEDRSSR